MTPLHFAVQGVLNACLPILLKHPDIDINALNENKESPLFTAVRKSALGSVRQLIEKNANTNLVNKEGETIFHIAISLNHMVRI